MTAELTIVDAAIEVDLDPIRSSGSVSIPTEEFKKLETKDRQGYSGWNGENAPINLLVDYLRKAGLPIDNESIIWTKQFKIAVAHALQRCGASWCVAEVKDGMTTYSWGTGALPTSGEVKRAIGTSTSQQGLIAWAS